MSTVALTMREMLEAGVHFGHLTRFRNPKMDPYIFGVQNRVNIINLDKTLPLFREALKFIHAIANKNGKILFVGTKRSAQTMVAEYAQKCGMPYVDHRWLGGMLTNYKTIKQNVKRLKELEVTCSNGTLEKLSKKEGLTLQRELDKLVRGIGGIKEMTGLPDALFVIDVGNEKIAIKEANRLKIPVIGILDTNNSPEGVDYPIPGNDDAMRAIQLYLHQVSESILSGKKNQTQGFSKFKEEPVAEKNDDSVSDASEAK